MGAMCAILCYDTASSGNEQGSKHAPALQLQAPHHAGYLRRRAIMQYVDLSAGNATDQS